LGLDLVPNFQKTSTEVTNVFADLSGVCN